MVFPNKYEAYYRILLFHKLRHFPECRFLDLVSLGTLSASVFAQKGPENKCLILAFYLTDFTEQMFSTILSLKYFSNFSPLLHPHHYCPSSGLHHLLWLLLLYLSNWSPSLQKECLWSLKTLPPFQSALGTEWAKRNINLTTSFLYLEPVAGSQGLQNKTQAPSLGNKGLHQHFTSDVLQTQQLLSPAQPLHTHICDSLLFLCWASTCLFVKTWLGRHFTQELFPGFPQNL